MDKIKGQLAGVAALLGVIAAIGGGFVKYGEVMTRLDSIQDVDTTAIETSLAVVEEKVSVLENADTTHSHNTSHTHENTDTKILQKEIELLKVQLEELKVSSSNPLAN
tara:strand:+ start:108 stop:431 length:324 start_codon:yes stop_codon:yes gene_type:complete